MTSSKMSSTSFSSQIRRSPSRNPGSGGITPLLAITGSVMIAASSCRWFRTRRSVPSRSLKVPVTMHSSWTLGIPALKRVVWGAASVPAGSNESAWQSRKPW